MTQKTPSVIRSYVMTLAMPSSVMSDVVQPAGASDTTAPTVVDVSSSTANGQYAAGSVIAVTVQFTEAVTVTGSPRIQFETGTTDRYATYASGSGGTTLTFNYTVVDGDYATDLDYVATDSLGLNGGSIKDAAGNDATLTLPSPGATHSLGANKAIVIFTVMSRTPHTWIRADAGTFEDAARTTPAADDGDTVLGLADQSGHAYHFSRASGGVVLKTNIQNSLPVLRGDGAATHYLSTSPTAFSALGNRTLYVVAKWGGSNFDWIWDGSSGGPTAASELAVQTATWSIAAGTRQTGGTASVAFKVFTFQFNTGGSDILRVNGVEVINAAAGNGTDTGWTLMARADGGGSLAGDWGETIVISGLDDATQILRMETLLAARWGITF